MRIHLLRHAIAGPRDPRRYPADSDRPLTHEGRRKMARAARGMRALGLRFDLVLTSPFVRARQTARIVATSLSPRPPRRALRPLSPGGGAGGVFAALASIPADASVLLVGHEPHLSRLAGAIIVEPAFALSLEVQKTRPWPIHHQGRPPPGAGPVYFPAH